MEIVTEEVLPVEASMSGGNTCYLHCPSLNRRSNYGVCLYTIRAHNEGRLSEASDCNSLVGRGLCEALSYQKKEQEAGRALYFKAREIKAVTIEEGEKPAAIITSPTRPDSESYMRGWNQVAERESTKRTKPVKVAAPKPKAKRSEIFGTEAVDLSDAVNEAVKSDIEKKEPKKAKPAPKKTESKKEVKATVRPDMSILERAKLMAQAK